MQYRTLEREEIRVELEAAVSCTNIAKGLDRLFNDHSRSAAQRWTSPLLRNERERRSEETHRDAKLTTFEKNEVLAAHRGRPVFGTRTRRPPSPLNSIELAQSPDTVSGETIYLAVYAQAESGLPNALGVRLPRMHQRRKRRGPRGKKCAKASLLGALRSIHDRPVGAEYCSDPRHFEGDLNRCAGHVSNYQFR